MSFIFSCILYGLTSTVPILSREGFTKHTCICTYQYAIRMARCFHLRVLSLVTSSHTNAGCYKLLRYKIVWGLWEDSYLAT